MRPEHEPSMAHILGDVGRSPHWAKGVRADRGVGVPPAGPVSADSDGPCVWMNSPVASAVHRPIWDSPRQGAIHESYMLSAGFSEGRRRTLLDTNRLPSRTAAATIRAKGRITPSDEMSAALNPTKLRQDWTKASRIGYSPGRDATIGRGSCKAMVSVLTEDLARR